MNEASHSLDRLGPGRPQVTVHGQPGDPLAWLTGRGDAVTLTVVSGGPLPALPAWR